MLGPLVGSVLQTGVHLGQVQQMIVLAAHNDPRSVLGEQIGKRSRIAVQSVQTRQDVGEGKSKRTGIALDGGFGSQQFSSVVAIACISKRAEPLMGMGLQDGRSRACHFSTLAPQVGRGGDQITSAMRRRKI